ncbi:MAG TPA: galactokinase [Verrucomicrobia bacterium]|nr:galactokinase [Verrucomicrobiota bacterium]
MTPKALREKVAREHLKRFDEEPQVFAYAPGRVEILGNHTDYNEGFVLSGAIQNGMCLGFSMAKEPVCTVHSLDLQKEASFNPEDFQVKEQPSWVQALQGVLKLLFERGKLKSCPAFNITIGSNLPMGMGLSSSAALDVAAALVLRRYLSLDISRHDLALICQQAEESYAGVRCGLLDPITSLFGVDQALLLTDFRSLEVALVSPAPRVVFAVCSTGVRHQLSESAYNDRRAECEAAVSFFAQALPHPVKSLRDVSLEEWTSLQAGMDPTPARRARHIFGENARAQEAVGLIRAGRYEDLGQLMYESHESSIKYFENSSPEQDFMVSQAKIIPGVLGARLTGGGFGGSVLLLLDAGRAAEASAALADAGRNRLGTTPEIFSVRLSSSARILPGTRAVEEA